MRWRAPVRRSIWRRAKCKLTKSPCSMCLMRRICACASTCGKGVYIRSLARDLGRFLGTFAHVSALRRTRVGGFDEKTALGLEKLTALGHSARDLAALDACLLPLETALDDIPALAFDDDAASCIRQGQAMSPSTRLFGIEKAGRCFHPSGQPAGWPLRNGMKRASAVKAAAGVQSLNRPIRAEGGLRCR